jgi:rod shape-determining protein MreD
VYFDVARYHWFMRPVSHQLIGFLPAVLAVLLVFLAAAPIDGGGLTVAPNVAWLMTLVMVAFYPPAWPRGLAFALGLLQDVLWGTPLGAQALLALLLAQMAALHAAMRPQVQLFRLRWLEAAGILVLWHLALWLLLQIVQTDAPSLRPMVRTGLGNALWYPVFYWLGTRLFAALPDAK